MKRWLFIGGIGVLCAAAAVGAFVLLSHSAAQSGSEAKPPPLDVAAVRARAQAGNAQAQVDLARLYTKGEEVTNSYAEAAKWFQRAADQTNTAGLLGLGELYEAGRGVPQDVPHAVRLYRQSAELGNADAQYTLAFLYESGRGVTQSHIEAAKWYQRAAEQGQALAQYDLGQRYNLGVGVALDRVEGLKWLMLAAAQGQPDAATLCNKVKKELSRAQVAEAQGRCAAFAVKKAQVP